MVDLPNLYGFTRSQLAAFLAARGFADAHVARLWRYLYRELVTDVADMDELPFRLRDRLRAAGRLSQLSAVRTSHADDGLTCKYLLGLADGASIETVLMRQRDRVTACVSSQVGCAVGCVFCATGQAGFTRNLTTAELTTQALFVERALRQRGATTPAPGRRGSQRDRRESLRNIVVMGMGEPLLNYDTVMDALEILGDPSGFALAAKRITISTVGVSPGIVRLADEGRPYSLAVSLHGATQAERTALIPAARAWPLDTLIEACRYYTTKLRRKIFFEWTLIDGVNDSRAQAAALGRLLQGIPAQVNLIPLNPTDGFEGTAAHAITADRFRAMLQDLGLPVSIRQRRGIDIAAGCGQLATLA